MRKFFTRSKLKLRKQLENRRRSSVEYEALEPRNLLATITADASLVGPQDWTSGTTWVGGVAPGANDRAIIPQNMTVRLDGASHTVKELVVQGTLEAVETPNVNRSLTSNWVHVNSGGVFQIGTAADRYDQGEFVLTLTGTNQNADFTVETAMGSMQITDNDGFLMAAGGGRLQFFGQDKLSFSKLAQTANAGSNQLVVENVIERNFDGTTSAVSDGQLNWEPGDQIVIASSSRNYEDQDVRTITAITDLGNGTSRLTLNANLSHRHYGEIESYDNGSRSIDLRAEVALLSRNVRVQGLASQDTDSNWGNRALFNSGNSGDHRGISGHVMIMGTAGQISVEGVQLDRLGQTGTLGRYPIHWHLAGDRAGDVLKGVSITNSNNRGVTVHGTHNLLIQDVVLHDIHGHGFFMEDGVETGTTYRSNIALGIHKVGRSDAVGNNAPDINDPFIVDTHDFVGQNPNRFLSSSGYWVTNPDNTWVGNIAAGVDGTGFWFILPDFAIGVSASDPQYNNVNANETPLGLFDHNSSHSSHVGFNMDRGFDIESPVGATLQNNSFGKAYKPEDANGQPVLPVFSNFSAYKHHLGVYHRGRYAQFDQFKFADNFTSTFITFSQSITNSLYVGHSRGNANLNEIVTGQSLYDGPNSMHGTHFAGFNRGSDAHVFRNHGGALRNTHVYISNTSFEDDGTKEQLSISGRDGKTYAQNQDPFDFKAPTAIYDVDGTLTGHGGGTAGSVLVPDNIYITDGNDIRPNGWDARISDDLYANFRIEFDNGNRRFTLITPDGDTLTNAPDNSHRSIIKASNEIYTAVFPDGVSSFDDGIEILFRIQLEGTDPSTITDSSIIRFQGFTGHLQVLEMSNIYNGSQKTSTTQVASLAELESVSGPAYWVDGDDLVVKFVTSSSEGIRYKFVPGSNTPLDPPPEGDVVNVSVTDDAYIQNTTTQDNTLLRIESSSNRTRTSYLKFDVPDTPGKIITGATLRLTVTGDAGANMRIRVYEGGSDSWTEGNLSTGNAPSKATLLDDITGDFVIGQVYNFDVSAAVFAGQEVTFVIDSDGSVSGGDAAFASSENGNTAIRPTLVVELEDDSSQPPVAIALGPVNSGIAVDDSATGTGYILYSAEDVFTRFSSAAPHVGNSQHLIAVRYNGVQLQYNDNNQWRTLTIAPDDRLLASVDFTNDTITSLQGATGQVNGVEQGFASGDLTFHANRWQGVSNPGEFTIQGTFFSTSGASTQSLGLVNSGIAVDDNATGTGYILYSAEDVFTRFSSAAPYVGNSQHLIAVRYTGVQWQYNDNSQWRTFTIATDDRLLASVDFTNDTITSLQGATGQVNGVEQGFASGDLTFHANRWKGISNPGEFTIQGTFFSTSGASTQSLGPVNSGIAVDDNATGTGYILYSAEDVFTRFSSAAPHVGNSQHLIAVRYNGVQWQYNDNSQWRTLTIATDDRLLASVDFTNDTITSLQGATGQVNGVEQGFASGDLTFHANRWQGVSNPGEFTIQGTFFSTSGASTQSLGPVNSGIAVDDNATGTGYILYSAEDVFTRFSSAAPYVGNSQHLIAVRYTGVQWQYNDNSQWRTLTIATDDRLLASVDFTNDTITSLQGATGQVNGVEQGFASGDLTFHANRWKGISNPGEFTIQGTQFAV